VPVLLPLRRRHRFPQLLFNRKFGSSVEIIISAQEGGNQKLRKYWGDRLERIDRHQWSINGNSPAAQFEDCGSPLAATSYEDHDQRQKHQAQQLGNAIHGINVCILDGSSLFRSIL
jgi:hypothetical protein